ncbi:MAG TPA: CpsB/CapC family capsule biosynthesis tyrosine phosphatase [Solirubrobacteraceae bacterium]|nr:CpsB/CapC family capsule biosynthesis tyrosine phosphatase [Solirubrobacteraceae bacterium]
MRRIPGTVLGYVDLHAHVLPGIDDGPSDMGGSIAMLRAAATAGIGTLAVTPHLRSDFPNVQVDELDRRCRTLRGACAREGIEIQIVCGAEVSLVWALEASDGELALATYGQRGTDLLIETPTFDVVGLESWLNQLRAKGLRVTLAHPERNVEFQRAPARLADLVRDGVLLQVNAETLLDAGRRSETHRLGRYLCSEGLAHALASDGHRAAGWRPVTCLAKAARIAAALVGPDRAHWMTHAAPEAIITGTTLPDAPEAPNGRRRHRLLRRRRQRSSPAVGEQMLCDLPGQENPGGTVPPP